ncbi:MAG: PHP-associated domain-containing protein [Candidatus Binatia bacterium]
MILDLHAHSEASDDSRAPLDSYLNWLQRKRELLPIDGIVLTEHRQWNPHADYRALEDKYGLLILRGAEVETDYGHMLLYGVTDEMARRFDFADVHLPAQELVREVDRMGGIAVPCHPGRPTIGLCEHYAAGRRPLDGVVAVEALNGGSRRGENERVADLLGRYGYAGFGGSDAHLVSAIGVCATAFDHGVRTAEDVVTALRERRCRPIDFRARVRAARSAS